MSKRMSEGRVSSSASCLPHSNKEWTRAGLAASYMGLHPTCTNYSFGDSGPMAVPSLSQV